MLVTTRHFIPVRIAQACARVRLASAIEHPAKEANFASQFSSEQRR